MFKAWMIDNDASGYRASVQHVNPAQLPEGDVEVEVSCSTLNYKDALALTGRAPVVRRFPMVPGIDFSGVVSASRHRRWQVGDEVVLNGWGVGETHWGGLAGRARVDGQWLVPKPAGLSHIQAMAIGTAGYTAMLCVMALERHGLSPGAGEVLVTGASGGVGSVAIALLAGLGHEVVASTGRPDEADYLRGLGASQVIERQLLATPGKPLSKERWAGVIDSVGSQTLANACAGTRYGGAVAACGLAGGMDFPATVAPFILRGITLYGIDSVMAPPSLREQAWTRLAQGLDLAKLDAITDVIGLDAALASADELLAGRVRGRLVVDVRR